MTAEKLSSPEHRDPYSAFPYKEDWWAIQGGRPRIFRNPGKPQARWIVLHVYDEHETAEKRFRSGAIVDTAPPDLNNIPRTPLHLKRKDEDGNLVERDIIVPSMMILDLHGNPCENRSSSMGGGGYMHIRNQTEYTNFISEQRAKGMQEIRYGVQHDRASLITMPAIRDPRPLGA